MFVSLPVLLSVVVESYIRLSHSQLFDRFILKVGLLVNFSEKLHCAQGNRRCLRVGHHWKGLVNVLKNNVVALFENPITTALHISVRVMLKSFYEACAEQTAFFQI